MLLKAYRLPDKVRQQACLPAYFTFEWVDKTLKVDYCTYLNLRSGPSTDYPILRSVPAVTETHIIAKCTENGWYRVIANGTVAYQCGYYFSNIQ